MTNMPSATRGSNKKASATRGSNKKASAKVPVASEKQSTRGPFVKMWNRTRTYHQCISCNKTKCAGGSADCAHRRCQPWAKDAVAASKALNTVECSNGNKVACAALKSVGRRAVPKTAAAMTAVLNKLWAVRSPVPKARK
jgi:hypothetical protein